MKKVFLRLPLPVKLMLAVLIPLVLLVFFAIQIFREKAERMELLGNYQFAINRSAQISQLVDALQAERRFAFGYALKNEFRTELITQRSRTDALLQQLLELDSSLRNMPAYTFLDSLPSVRRQVDDQVVAPPLVMNYYTNVIFRVNTFNGVSMGANQLLRPIAPELTSQKLLSEMVTYMGILRASIYMQLHLHQLNGTSVEGLRGIYDIFKSFEHEFRVKGSDSAQHAYDVLLAQSALRPTYQFVDTLFRGGVIDSNYNAERWWDISANGVDQLRSLQRATLNKAQKGVQQLYDQERDKRDKSLVYLIVALVLVAFVVSTVIVSISRQLNELNEAAVRIARGETGVHLQPQANDVVGSLTRSVMAIDASNQRLAEAADAIGSGRFDLDVHARSEKDVLGNAVVRMKSDLQQYAQESEDKLWQAAGMDAVNECIRGEKDPARLAYDALQTIADYCGAQVGLCYVRQQDHLEHRASYAVDDESKVQKQIAFGETLVGQAARKQKLMQLANVPEQFVKVRTGSGEAAPTQVVILPLVFNERTEGVLELAALQPFTPRVLAFLQQLQPVVGVALHTARNRARLQELLHETQAQSEELQAQHQELENINAELEAQAEKLQASEEELRVQQEELMEANQELEERTRLLEERNVLIAQRNREIQQKAEELAVSTRYKSEFLANMSHELRTPLNSILLLSRLLAENLEKNLSTDQVEYAQVIQSSGQGLLALIDEILDLSKIEAGKMELEFLPVPPAALVHDLRGMFMPLAQDKGLRFEVELDPSLPGQIETDKMRLEQVLKNLLSNALKFTTEGSVTLKLEAGAPGYVRFAVRDTGIGIPADKQALVFEAFRQADGSTRRKYGGTGLGLSISRELTRLLGGELRLESEPEKGSTFYFELPETRKIAEAAAGPPPAALPTRPDPAPAPV
ncbi:MAG: GAF domain-containing protein, partial [Chitinophagaceae bacterium]